MGITEVAALLGTYEENLKAIKTNLLLTPEELWGFYQYLPEDLNHEDLSGVKAKTVAQALASHPNLAPEQILFFLNHKNIGLRQRALRHPNFPPLILKDL